MMAILRPEVQLLANRLKLAAFVGISLLLGCEQRRSSSIAAPPKDDRQFTVSYHGKFPVVTKREEMDVYEAVIHHNHPLENRVEISRFVHKEEFLGTMNPGEQDFVDPSVGTEFPAIYTLVEKNPEGAELRRVTLTLSILDGLFLDETYRGDADRPIKVGRLILTAKALITAPARGYEINAEEIQAAKGSRLVTNQSLEDGEAPGVLRVRAKRALGELTVEPLLKDFTAEEIEEIQKEGEVKAEVLDSGSQPVDIRIGHGEFSLNVIMREVSQDSKLESFRAALLRNVRFDRGSESFTSCGGKLFPRENVSGIYERLDRTEPGTHYLWFSPRLGTPYGFSPLKDELWALPPLFQSMNSYPCDGKGKLRGLMTGLQLLDPNPKLSDWKKIEAGELPSHPKAVQDLARLIEAVHELDRVLDPLGYAAEALGDVNFRSVSERQVAIANAFLANPETVAAFLRTRQLKEVTFEGGLMDHFIQKNLSLLVPAGLTESPQRIVELMKADNLPVRLLGELYR